MKIPWQLSHFMGFKLFPIFMGLMHIHIFSIKISQGSMCPTLAGPDLVKASYKKGKPALLAFPLTEDTELQ